LSLRRDTAPVVVDDPRRLADALGRARDAGRIGLDTEFFRERTYRARLCLAQIATPDELFLVDPLAEVDMAPVAAVIEDPAVEVVVHAGGQDIEIFHEQYGVTATRIFDVQRAAGFAGHGASLPYGGLVSEVLGVSLEKGESYTDWCRRPLTGAQLTYAADDVRWLLPVADKLNAAIEALGRTPWVEEEMQAIEQAASRSVSIDDAWRKVGGRGSLSGRAIAVLRELAWWREQTAKERDIPRGWVVRDASLVEMARRAPADKAALGRIRGVNAKEVERSWRDIASAVDKGRSAAPVVTSQGPPRNAQMRARMLSGIGDALVRARCEHAKMASELVTTRGETEALIAEVVSGELDATHHRLLKGWRRELAGDALVELARGRIAVKAIDRPPYVEEVRV